MNSVVLPNAEAFDAIDVTKGPAGELLTESAKTAILADAICKALTPPPAVYSYATFNTLPDPNADAGIIPWPGLPPDTLRKMANTLLAPKIVIDTRQQDVAQYSQLTKQTWRKGWSIELLDSSERPTAASLRKIREAERFIANCNFEYDYTQARERDANQYTDFGSFLARITRDSFTYDGIALYTDCDTSGRVLAFSAIPAGSIRLTNENGYNQNKKIFAVLVNEGQQVIKEFDRNELVWVCRNPRTDPEVGRYGFPELDQASRLVEAFDNAMELNADTFTKNGIPNGMLVFKGLGFTPRELDLITRMWNNLKKGITKQWALPAMALPPDSELELIDFSSAKDKDALFQEHLNLTIGIYCLLCGISPKKLGFRISGKVGDTRPDPVDQRTPAAAFDDEDVGLTDFLSLIEQTINQYILWTRFPTLRFVFRGKTPREDAREYEVRQLAETYGERRAKVDLKPLEKLVENEEHKELAQLMDLCPCDPGLVGTWQNIVSSYLKGKQPQGAGDGNFEQGSNSRFTGAVDGAKKEAHGNMAGTRRNAE